MSYFKKPKKILKVRTSSLFFILIILETSVFLYFIYGFLVELPQPSLIVFTAEEEQKPLYNENLSEFTVVPIAHTDVSLKDTNTKIAIVLSKSIQKIPEAHLVIPRIGVDAIIKDMGVTLGGAMDVPGNRIDVGWYNLGTRPGNVGSAVIGAHNRFNSKDGVFVNLNKLEKGDVLSVVDDTGASISFVVRDIRTYDATDTSTGIFESQSGVHLNLITCSGDFDPVTKSSKKRLVVFTDAIETINQTAMLPI